MRQLTISAIKRLRALSLACQMLADELDAGLGATEPLDQSTGSDAVAMAARRLLKLRRRREAQFGPSLFADPAWDILLDLLIAESEGRPISVSSLCIAAAVPATTALRWIGVLTEAGLIVRQPHASDRRAVLVSLQAETSARLRDLLAEL